MLRSLYNPNRPTARRATMTRDKKLDALFRHKTNGVWENEVIAGFSLNAEIVAEGLAIPEIFRTGRSKITVAEITAPLDNVEGHFLVRPLAGNPERIWARKLFGSQAGSSVNIQLVLDKLQQDKPANRVQHASILATVGQSERARSLVSKLDEAKVEYALMAAEGTNVTLNFKVRGSKEQVMLCEKGSWIPPAGLINLHRQADPRVVVYTGIREESLSTVRDIFIAYRNKKAFRVFAPHLDLLDPNRAVLQEHVREVIRMAHLLAVSEDEALALAAKTSLFGDHNPFDATNEAHVEQLVKAVTVLGAQITTITFAEHGVVVMAAGKIIRHHGFRPPKAVRDTAGAGDAFLAALIYFYILTHHRVNTRAVNLRVLEAAVEQAQVVSSHKVCHLGSSSGILSEPEVERYLQKNGSR